ncbi:MAG: NUDIX hydrolase [Caldilineaceae bacterium]|nr:NUDIX hydrolase [Caldilineaceae bacterium]
MNQFLLPVEAHELAALRARFGPAPHEQVRMTVDSPFLDGEGQLLTTRNRRAEICYILHRGNPQEAVLLHRKTYYPAQAWRLPTGGVEQDESVLDTLAREIEEETSFQIGKGPVPVRIEAFLGVLSYEMFHQTEQRTHSFATWHFLVSAPPNAQPVSMDPDEHLDGWDWRSIDGMGQVADELEEITAQDDQWYHWGRYRALSHRFVRQRWSARLGRGTWGEGTNAA